MQVALWVPAEVQAKVKCVSHGHAKRSRELMGGSPSSPTRAARHERAAMATSLWLHAEHAAATTKPLRMSSCRSAGNELAASGHSILTAVDTTLMTPCMAQGKAMTPGLDSWSPVSCKQHGTPMPSAAAAQHCVCGMFACENEPAARGVTEDPAPGRHQGCHPRPAFQQAVAQLEGPTCQSQRAAAAAAAQRPAHTSPGQGMLHL